MYSIRRETYDGSNLSCLWGYHKATIVSFLIALRKRLTPRLTPKSQWLKESRHIISNVLHQEKQCTHRQE